MGISGVTAGDTIISNFEQVIYELQSNFPNTKILYVNTSNTNREIVENMLYEYIITQFSLEDFNGLFGTSATSYEEIKEQIIGVLTNGISELGFPPMIPNFENRYNEIQNQIKNAVTKYDIEYLDLSQYITQEDLQYNYYAINANGYERLTPYLVEKINQMLDYELTDEDLEVGKNGEITEIVLTDRQTGTGPFDDDNNPGNDENAENNVVRTFDQVTWTIDATMGIKSGATVTDLKGGVLSIRAELPENCAGKIEWDIESMAWTNGTESLSENGRVFTAKYVMNKEESNIPGQQSIVLVAKVLNAENGLTFNPTFTMYIEGNEVEEAKTIKDSEDIIVSATAKYNIGLVYHNAKQQIEINEEQKTVLKNSLAFMLLGDNESKGIKGIELPNGDLTFDIKYSLSRVDEDTQDVTDISQYMRLYNYKYNDENTEVLGNSENILSDFPRDFLFSTGKWPWSNRSNGETDERKVVYQNGNLTMVDDEEGTIRVTISDYGVSENFPDRIDQIVYSSDSEDSFEDNIGIISVGMFYMEIDANDETTMEGTQLYFKLEADNMNVNTIGGTSQSEEVTTLDNEATGTIITNSEGRFFKQIHYGNRYFAFLSSLWGEGDATGYRGQNDIYIMNIIESDMNNDITDWIRGVDILTKFDDKVVEVRLNDDGSEYSISIENGEDMTFNILYAGKTDKTGWTSDEEMNSATIEDLVYFDTLEELKSAGYVCVATLAESTGGEVRAGFDLNVSIPIEIKKQQRLIM